LGLLYSTVGTRADNELAHSVCRRVAGLVPKASATAATQRRCEKDGDDDDGDESGAGDEQSAIHG
jgi:hypothetical protein